MKNLITITATKPKGWILRRTACLAAGVGAMLALVSVAGASGNPPLVSISNVPLLLVQPTQPQVLLVVANSQSMDGNLSGAVMTGSGTPANQALWNSSSPQTYRIPAGFTPPVAPGSAGYAAYTVPITKGTTTYWYDNSPSRLNVAKQAMMQVITQYADSFSMGIMDYSLGSATTVPIDQTWLYYMSASDPDGDGSGHFTFGDQSDPLPPGTTEWVANPCYLSLQTYCNSIQNVIGSNAISEPYVAVAATSDDPDINDVLYSSQALSPVCLDYGGPTPPTPYPPNYNLLDYNNGTVSISYDQHTGICATQTSPTNAGYVPYSDQVLYAQRGFGFYGDAAQDPLDVPKDGSQPGWGTLVMPILPASCANANGTGTTGNCSNPATQAQIQHYINLFVPYFSAESSNTAVPTNTAKHALKAQALQSPLGGALKGAYDYFQGWFQGYPPPPSNTGCIATRYTVVVTDGLPTEDLSGKYWPPLGTQSANGYGVHATFDLKGGGTVSDDDPSFAADVAAGLTLGVAQDQNGDWMTNDQALIDALNQIQMLLNNTIGGQQGIQTYVVGLGAGVDPTKNPAVAASLKAMAIAGGTSNYFAATTPQDVVNDFAILFGQIQAANMSSTSVAVNSTSYRSNTVVYQARFDTETYGWTGDVIAMPLLADGTVDENPYDQIWSAKQWMNANYSGTGWQNRLTATVNTSTGAGIPFEAAQWSQLSATQQTDLESQWTSLNSTQQTAFCGGTTVCAAYGKAVLGYLRGDQSQTVSNGGPFRNRETLMSDVVHSAPLYVAGPNGLYSDPAYNTFMKTYASRKPVIYVGADDGMVHAFDASNGAELFTYLPAGSFANLANLSNPAYDANHLYYVDGSPNAGDAKFSDGTWHTLLVGGLNDGGAGIYALDVTDPSSWTSQTSVASNVLWDITSATTGFGHLGLTYSQPQIAQIDCSGTNCNSGGNTFVVIFGSGYNNDNGRAYLYVVNAQTGGLIKAVDLCSFVSGTYCKTSEPEGVSTPVVVSSTASTVSDRAFVGDLQGNLWRVDLSDPSPANWSAAILFHASSGGNDQPITTQPLASFAPPAAGGGLIVFFGTGQYLGVPDISNTNTQSFYGVLDQGTAPTSPYTQSNLAQMTLTDTTLNGIDVRTVSGSAVNWSSQKGWYMNLPDTGERIITDPRILGGRVIFTTFVPDTTTCSAGGSSWLMTINYATGGAFPAPEFDVNGDSQLNSGDQVNGQNPVGLGLGPGYAAAPRLMLYHQGPFNDLKLITISTSPVKSVKERGVAPGELSWTEIR